MKFILDFIITNGKRIVNAGSKTVELEHLDQDTFYSTQKEILNETIGDHFDDIEIIKVRVGDTNDE